MAIELIENLFRRFITTSLFALQSLLNLPAMQVESTLSPPLHIISAILTNTLMKIGFGILTSTEGDPGTSITRNLPQRENISAWRSASRPYGYFA